MMFVFIDPQMSVMTDDVIEGIHLNRNSHDGRLACR